MKSSSSAAMRLNVSANSPTSEIERTGTRVANSPRAKARDACASSLIG
jgi:hypothetical protein